MITFNAHVHEHTCIMCVHIKQREHNHVHALHLCFTAQTCVYTVASYPVFQCCIQSWEGLGTGLHIHVHVQLSCYQISYVYILFPLLWLLVTRLSSQSLQPAFEISTGKMATKLCKLWEPLDDYTDLTQCTSHLLQYTHLL